MADINLIFDKKLNRLNMYRSDKWDDFLIDVGVQELIRIVKSTYLDICEAYLIKKMTLPAYNAFDKNNYRLLINEYYQFIAFFDLPPTVYQKTDDEIIGDNEYSLEDTYMVTYNEIKNKTNKVDRRSMKVKVADIIKRNTLHNIDELNKNIISMIRMDENFYKTNKQYDNKSIVLLMKNYFIF